VIFFFAQSSLGDEHWEIAIRNAILLEAGVKETLNVLPNEVSERSEDIASGDFVILDHFTLGNDLLVPL
jgi:hypothetical protein